MQDDKTHETNKTKIVEEVKLIREKNSQALTELRELFQKADQEKTYRDSENATVKEIASQIDSTRKGLTELGQALSKLQGEVEPFKEQLGSAEKIKVEISALEYSLHVSYSPAREKAVSRKVAQLNKQLKTTQAIAPKLQELTQLRRAFRELKKKLSTAVIELKAHAAKSEEHHQVMLSTLKQADALQAALPESFNQLNERQSALTTINKAEHEQRQKQLGEIRAEKRIANAQRERKMHEVKQRAHEIMERFKLGQPISLEDLQVLQTAGIEL